MCAIGPAWRELEHRADPSPFQRWSWVGCLAEERYRDPVLLEASVAGETVGLALCNRRGRRGRRAGGRLFLGETGDPRWDGLYVEHNGPLLARGHEQVLAPMLDALMRAPLAKGDPRTPRMLMLSGVPEQVIDGARALPGVRVLVDRTRPAPFADLTRLGGGGYAATLGASTRYQLGRSRRAYARRGPIGLQRAQKAAEALAFFEALVTLHQATWMSRGKPGAFADARLVRFHRCLIQSGVPRGEVELARVQAGAEVVGYLYNLRSGARLCNYQSGFDYARAGSHERPGLTCHECAAEDFWGRGGSTYDFLAGEDRYKRNLGHAQTGLCWARIAPSGSLAGLQLALARLRLGLRRRLRAPAGRPGPKSGHDTSRQDHP